MKKSLLVGINYNGSPNQLRGCVNDVRTMEDVITQHYDFHDNTILTDNAATTQNILEGLEWLVDGAQEGDVLFFHYSGHGSQVIDTDGFHDEADGLDECLCPIDLNWKDKIVKDDDICRIFNKLPKNVNATILLDCCHSGDGADSIHAYQPKSTTQNRLLARFDFTNRYMPVPEEILMEMAATRSFNQRTMKPFQPKNETAILLSGCRSNQTSADAFINQRWIGAATFFLNQTLRESNFKIDYTSLINVMNIKLGKYGYSQQPELNGHNSNFTKKFLQPFVGK